MPASRAHRKFDTLAGRLHAATTLVELQDSTRPKAWLRALD
ncbi:MAG: hypothetical protein ACREWI_00980 [Telluria sp.]